MGPRTRERTCDVQPADAPDVKSTAEDAIALVLRTHKTAHHTGKSRIITLDEVGRDIVTRACAGKAPAEPIFTDPKGRRWEVKKLCSRFRQVRARAGVPDHITPYNFRHTKISEVPMRKGSNAEAAKLAGTSVAMAERVYGHFREDH